MNQTELNAFMDEEFTRRVNNAHGWTDGTLEECREIEFVDYKTWCDAREAVFSLLAHTPDDINPLDFQIQVNAWMLQCFGQEISNNITERNHRFLEESIELVQSLGCTASEAHQLVDYVFSRPVGDPEQETGGVMVTLAALCNASRLSMVKEGATELSRVWGCVEKIRAKQAAKPKHSPLPESSREKEVLASSELLGLLSEVSSNFTRDDDLPDGLLPRIDAVLVRHGA